MTRNTLFTPGIARHLTRLARAAFLGERLNGIQKIAVGLAATAVAFLALSSSTVPVIDSAQRNAPSVRWTRRMSSAFIGT